MEQLEFSCQNYRLLGLDNDFTMKVEHPKVVAKQNITQLNSPYFYFAFDYYS